jgi:polar amino acid transport system permease protein
MSGFGATVGRARDAFEARTQRIPYRLKLAVVWIVIFLILAWALLALGLDTDYMRQWAPFIMKGIPLTLIVCFGGIALAIPLALLGALGRLSKNPVPNGLATFYISLFRGTPLIVQIFFIYLALPQLANSEATPEWLRQLFILDIVIAGILALGLNYGAYMSEIFRAGILSVGHGQLEAAHALAMTGPQTMRRIVLPQALRVIVPPTGNEFIAMLKDSSLVGLAGTQEVFFRAQQSGRAAFRTLETLLVAAAIYWALTAIFEIIQRRIERRFSRGFVRQLWDETRGHGAAPL